ncbi:MAG TPA: outer membrane protein transport protein [Candidatus Polarisedimenticolia bacterium]|nr:outer membrane protein transport protein [Candidatus Polarisedimenticolia bacterium]
MPFSAGPEIKEGPMRGKTRLGVAMLSLAVGGGGAAFGSGYSVYEQGAEAMANAGAFTARADDPSALFFNPAGILQLDRFRLNIGTNAIFLTGAKFDSTASGQGFRQDDNVAWPSSLYYTQKISDRFAWGLAFTSPFGLKTQWGPTFDGRYISREANLAVVNVNPNFAFRLGKSWSAAVGIDYARADVRELSKNIDFTNPPLALGAPDGFTKLTGDGSDTGWNLAIRWAGDKGWRWGGSYRSGMKPEIQGDVVFQKIPGAVAALFPNGGATAVIPLPASFATGVGYISKGKWEGEFDVVWTDWSVFDHLRIDIKNNTVAVTDIDQLEEWKDSYSFRVGYSYHLSDRHEYRLGAYFDRNPVPAAHVRPRLPDANRTSAQVGYGYHGKGGFTFDVAYQALFFADRTATGSPVGPGGSGTGPDPVQPGRYQNFTSLLGASVGWKF